MNIHSIYSFFMARFRPSRIAQLKKLFPQIDGKGKILDVGGTCDWWNLVQPGNREITIVNLDSRHQQSVQQAGYGFATADARALPYADRAFDLAFSNSVIEHVGGWEDQRRFAAEMLRCGKEIYLQTPYKWFPIEPHLIAPFLHWLPHRAQKKLVRWFSVWGWVARPSQPEIDAFVQSTRLLTYGELQRLFPNCEIRSERFLWMTKSLIVMRRA